MKQIENLQAEKDDLANRMKKLQEGMIGRKVAERVLTTCNRNL